jgi:hypothetical protein
LQEADQKEYKVDGYTIDASNFQKDTDFKDENGNENNEKIEDLTVVFLKDSSKSYNKCGENFDGN